MNVVILLLLAFGALLLYAGIANKTLQEVLTVWSQSAQSSARP